ncbi:sensor histidine kinase [Herbaspirillum rhizosphaerae]|uniref:sensor histidine kinase n=1 Tax=Herbaspirillum rhizosphaerae TaxID=346179 RepID=UPI00067C5C35|nr:HAMP domain-containing sensor histidine kinase [Herbaspirillum rhizosphaerae]
MKLYYFITKHMNDILAEWERFAHVLSGNAHQKPDLVLRDHAREILQAIAVDIETLQNPEQQQLKSQGLAPGLYSQRSAASIHGALRQAGDFSLLQVSAEYRALRATVLRLWLPQVETMSGETIQQMVRFNEAIDQALSESVLTFSARADHTRELFLAILGHDLRAPLTTMGLTADLMMHAILPAEKVMELGARIKRSARMMNAMVDDLLGYTRTQLGNGMPTLCLPTDLLDVFRSVVEEAGSMHPKMRFELHTDGDLNGSFDAVRMHQLFSNLLLNAAQYGTSERPVTLDARSSDIGIVVSVKNYGTEIPFESLQSIFRPLVQLPTESGNDGRPRTSLGLGLFIAREVALAHGGSIKVESSTESGTIFTVELPANRA